MTSFMLHFWNNEITISRITEITQVNGTLENGLEVTKTEGDMLSLFTEGDMLSLFTTAICKRGGHINYFVTAI